jgi:hypothetical protein
VFPDLRISCVSDYVSPLYPEANRNLTWRDMQHIVVATSNPQPLQNEDGKNISEDYGHEEGTDVGVVLCVMMFLTVLRIRIRIRIRIHMFLGLLDPDPDPLVSGMDPEPDPALDTDPDYSII